jgi:hypothetical protein
VALKIMGRSPRATCRRGHAKEPGKRCKECDRLTYRQRAAARKAEGLTARGRPLYSLRTHCLHGHLRSENEVPRKTGGYSYCRACNLERLRRRRQSANSSEQQGEAAGQGAMAVISKNRRPWAHGEPR